MREAKLFRNNRSQAVRIPAEFEFSGSSVLIRKDGTRLIIEPQPKPNLTDLLKSFAPLDAEDEFPEDIDGTLLPLAPIDL
ncbi:antitoxin [uncultured Sphingomonas sp.]|uniref:antitoxin n=1 Tax=uncultured Sphingomonas sp. TaxID=158754 RepID=UPI0035CBD2AF